MKRRRSDRSEWRRIVERRFHVAYLDTPEFTGYLTLLVMKKVSAPFWVRVGDSTCCVADTGFAWLQHFPAGSHHTLTTMFDAGGNVVQWYVDICAQHGVDDRGIPWFDDLYLDIVMSPSGAIQLLDVEELDDALRTGRVLQREYDLACAEAQRLMDEIASGSMPLMKLSALHLHRHFSHPAPPEP